MSKHAYCIIAHDKFEQLEFLMTLLDDQRNDIFLHISEAVPDDVFEHLQNRLKSILSYSNVYFSPSVKVSWGNYTQIEAEYSLFKTVSNSKNAYSYVHLLSGVDLPLVSQDKIHAFFKKHQGKNFLTMVSGEIFEANNIEERVKFHYLFPKISERNFNTVIFRKFFRLFRKSELFVNRLLKIDYLGQNISYLSYASNWLSITSELLDIIIHEEEWVRSVFKKSILCDELFIPTIIKKHKLEDTLYTQAPVTDSSDEFQGNCRYINWWDGSPYTWTDSDQDIDQLKKGIQLGHFFSRKFDLNSYPNLKEIVINLIEEE